MALDIYQTVTDRIVQALESGSTGTYTCPWHRQSGLPRNGLTGKIYRGVNVLSLWCAGYGDSRWATYRQWAELGTQVRKGEKASPVVFYRDYTRKGEDGEDEKRLVVRASWAFNADQVDDAPASPDSEVPGAGETPEFDAFVIRTGARVLTKGNQALYDPNADEIRMPARQRFLTSEGYASTLSHELVHWTGERSRLNRDFSGRFRSASYAAEELVAELGAAFTLATLGLASEPVEHHASYIASWLSLLKHDNRAIFTAASAASKAVDYLTRETG